MATAASHTRRRSINLMMLISCTRREVFWQDRVPGYASFEPSFSVLQFVARHFFSCRTRATRAGHAAVAVSRGRGGVTRSPCSVHPLRRARGRATHTPKRATQSLTRPPRSYFPWLLSSSRVALDMDSPPPSPGLARGGSPLPNDRASSPTPSAGHSNFSASWTAKLTRNGELCTPQAMYGISAVSAPVSSVHVRPPWDARTPIVEQRIPPWKTCLNGPDADAPRSAATTTFLGNRYNSIDGPRHVGFSYPAVSSSNEALMRHYSGDSLGGMSISPLRGPKNSSAPITPDPEMHRFRPRVRRPAFGNGMYKGAKADPEANERDCWLFRGYASWERPK